MATTTASNLPDATRLAVERTYLAHDRTLMAWVRTATSLISFGFTMYKFFEYLREGGKGAGADGMIGPRGFATIMIVIGLGALIVATLEHRHSLRLLRRQYGAVVPRSLTTVVAGLIGCLGILGLLLVVFQQ